MTTMTAGYLRDLADIAVRCDKPNGEIAIVMERNNIADMISGAGDEAGR